MLGRRVLVTFVLVAVVATGSTAATAPEAMQRIDALERLLTAARSGDEPAMWSVLSRVSRRRLGPTLADFRARGARGVRASVAPYAYGSYRVVVNTAIHEGLGLVGVARRDEAFAVPLRRDRGVWKVEIDPVFTVEAVRPLPAEHVLRRTQLFAEVAAPRRLDHGVMWFDGRLFDARTYWSRDQKHMSIWGEAPQPLRNGRHTVVAFAMAGPEAAANAWSFTARGRGSGSR
jgi:hypothetical protein